MATLKEILGSAYRDDMSLADIESAISSMKLADLSSGEYVSKGKLADYEARMKKAEKALQDKMSEEEKAQAKLAEREEYYKQLEKENALNRFTAKLGKTIKDETVLAEVAGLFAEGEFSKAIDKQNEYLANYHSELEKSIKTSLMQQNPQPNPQKDKGVMTKEKFKTLSLAEKQQMATTDPETYKKMTT